MKQIKLIPNVPFYNSVDVAVLDFPDGTDAKARQRCKITVEFAEYDVRRLQARGLDFPTAMGCYRDQIYQLVKLNISQDWECVGGMDEVLAIVEAALKRYFVE